MTGGWKPGVCRLCRIGWGGKPRVCGDHTGGVEDWGGLALREWVWGCDAFMHSGGLS